LTSTIDGGGWSASSRTGYLAHRKTTHDTHSIADWLDPKAGLDTRVEKKRILVPPRNRTSVVHTELIYPGSRKCGINVVDYVLLLRRLFKDTIPATAITWRQCIFAGGGVSGGTRRNGVPEPI
jgi:hypothetical protein